MESKIGVLLGDGSSGGALTELRIYHGTAGLSKLYFGSRSLTFDPEGGYTGGQRKGGQMISLHIFVHVVYQLQKTHGQRGRWTLHFGSAARTNFPDVVRRTQSTEG